MYHGDLTRQAEQARRAAELQERFPNALAPSQFQIRISWAVLVVLLTVGAIQTAGPEALGIPAVAFRWLGVIAIVFSGIQGFLPGVQKWGGSSRG